MCYNFYMKEMYSKYQITLNEEQEKKFNKYYEMLVEYNEKFNLTAITGKKEVIVKHFIDSLLGSGLLISGKLIDIGSGGGFPCLPLKIYNDNLEVVMVEATEKKCMFLRKVIEELGLKNAKVICGRAEDIAFNSEYREKFDYCTARAVARLNILSEYCIPFIKKGGKFISYKGNAEEEILEAEKGIKILGGEIKEVKRFDLEGNNREIIVIEKKKPTEMKYPRSNAKIRKNPL